MADLGTFTEEVILPGVEDIVKEEVGGLRDEMKAGFKEMRDGFKEMGQSIRVLAGEMAELKVREEDQGHEGRIGRIERRLGIARP